MGPWARVRAVTMVRATMAGMVKVTVGGMW